MEWLNDIAGNVANVASGGILGLIGSMLGVGAKYLQERAEEIRRQNERIHELELLKLQMQARAEETEQELALVSQQGAWAGLTSSQSAAAGLNSHVHTWVNDVRALVRPVLTFALVAVVYLLFRDLQAAMTGGESRMADLVGESTMAHLVRYIIEGLVFAATTAVVWWFGERAMTMGSGKGR